MTQDVSFLPMLAMIAIIFVTALWMLALRIRAVRQGRLSAGYFRLNRAGKEPARLALAWLYVLLRLLHGLVHTTYHNVLHRLTVFLASIAMLGALWVRIGSQLLGA